MPAGKIGLVVGIDSYRNRPLRVCVHDAKEVTAALTFQEYGFALSTLLDEQATRQGLRKGLETLFRQEADTYIFYFSGHGWATDLGVFLVTVDANEDEQGVELDYIRRLIDLTPRESAVVVILDCCHAGAAMPRAFSGIGVDIRAQDVAKAIPSLPQDRVVMAACRGDQLAYEDTSLNHGVFTFHLLQGLMGDAADSEGAITVTRLYDHVSRAMSSDSLQTPMFRGDFAGRMVLGRGFMPQAERVLSEALALELEREAYRHLQEYQNRFALSVADLNEWKVEGYKTACQTLTPILKWFDRQLEQHSNLKARPAFMEQKKAAMQRLSTLCGLEVGTTTPEGIVREEVGTGTFGTVWKVECPNMNAPLAYKVYHARDLAIGEKVRRFERGYNAMKQLDHPYIIKVQGFTECPLGFYMDFIDGPNLRNFTGTLEEPRSLVNILLAVAETLRHAHRRGVIHRDVKPENIIMNFDVAHSQWRPFLTDFDLAWFSTATQVFTREGMGSVYYAAPEQMATPTAASAHAVTTDIYSFGQLCYFVATGSNPVPLGMADNIRALEQRLGGGWYADAAENFLNLYVDCTKQEPGKRPAEFGIICERVYSIWQAMTEMTSSKTLSTKELVKEILFSMVGLGLESQQGEDSFLTLSTKTRVNITVRSKSRDSVSLIYTFHSQEPPMLEGIRNFEQLRSTLLGRIDSVLSKFGGARKRHGSQAPFQVFIDHDNIPLALDGVALSRSLISRVLDVLEGK